MHLFAALSAIVIGVARAEQKASLDAFFFHDLPEYAAYIDIAELNKAYSVKLDCVDCPFVAASQDSQQDNALLLRFTIDSKSFPEPKLLLNGRVIFPLEPVYPLIEALQVPPNVTWDDLNSAESDPNVWGVQLPLLYEHTVQYSPEPGQYYIIFDVIGLALDSINDPRYPGLAGPPMTMDKEEQKLVELIIQYECVKGITELFIDYIVVCRREHRTPPWQTKLGQPAMVQTSYNPNEWDRYGKHGTWARTQSLIKGMLGDIWLKCLQNNTLLLPYALLLACGIIMLRLWHKRRLHTKSAVEDDEIVLLGSVDKDAPQAFAAT